MRGSGVFDDGFTSVGTNTKGRTTLKAAEHTGHGVFSNGDAEPRGGRARTALKDAEATADVFAHAGETIAAKEGISDAKLSEFKGHDVFGDGTPKGSKTGVLSDAKLDECAQFPMGCFLIWRMGRVVYTVYFPLSFIRALIPPPHP